MSPRRRLTLTASLGVALLAARVAQARPSDTATSFSEGVRAFRDGDYAQAQTLLGRVLARPRPKSPAGTAATQSDDWVLYLHGESAFYAGAYGKARDDFERLAKVKSSRFALAAAFR